MIPWLLSALVGVAAAAPGWETTPYLVPRLNIRAVSANGVSSAQALVGVEGGLVSRQAPKPHWMNQTRTVVTGMYSLTHGTLGADLRLGSFFGPDGKVVRWLSGPDVWLNGYGSPDARDYYLPWAPGVDLRNTAMLKLLRGFALVGEATPGWTVAPSRQAGGIGPFHELTVLGAVAIDSDVLTITIGYQRSWTAVGIVEGLVISGGL